MIVFSLNNPISVLIGLLIIIIFCYIFWLIVEYILAKKELKGMIKK
jgi:hypothetical protein